MHLLYFLPLYAQVRLRRLPWVTLLLVALNVVVFCFYQYGHRGFLLINAWALIPSQPDIVSAIMANFLHASWGHLAGNMLYFWVFGAPVEDRIGPVKMLLGFLVVGAVSLLAHAWFVMHVTPNVQGIAILGASGAVSGITGMFLVRFYYVRMRVGIPVLLALRGIRRGLQFTLPALAVVAIWSGIQLASGLIDLYQHRGGTAYGAHIAGLVCGIVLGFLFGLGRGARVERMQGRAERYFRETQWYLAQEEYARYLALVPGDMGARLQLARAHMLTRQDAAAGREYIQVVRMAMERRDRVAAHEAYQEMRRILPLDGLPLELQRRMAEMLESHGEIFGAAEAWERYGRLEPQSGRAVPALMRAARLYASKLGNLDRARQLYERVVERHPEMDAAGVAVERLQSLELVEAAS